MSQTLSILKYLQDGNTITPIEALNKFGSFRVGARILEIRKLGYNVITEWEHRDNKKWAKYRLVKETLF